MAGKGDKLRKGANLNLYWQNYDGIFKRNKMKSNRKAINASRAEIRNRQEHVESYLLADGGDFSDWAWISIHEPGNDGGIISHPELDKCPNLKLAFWDVTCHYSEIDQVYGPTPEDAVKIVDFLLENYRKNIVVNCAAGISRSGAVCQFLEDELGYDWLRPYKNRAFPNHYLLKMMKEYYHTRYKTNQ